MGFCKRPLVQLLWVVLVFIFIFGHCKGSRSSNQFKVMRPKSQNSGHFLGFLPRRIPIPASGPSRKHNDIGLQGWTSSP
ncbi:Protein IDA-LIKE 2 like [Actinidia chinensis var. chinensis]|uniref:Protein IDA-LIKE 2 like n=1 Tax=Actinidia chinensis var. chinensis TaxID=1590841 RepID=A0A2R6RDL9_ACTCC|nr:Protein IDA-LIKE 2 like [Actinidia chinensis var. chinensis]